MDEKERLINLVDDKVLFDENLSENKSEDELEEEYKQGIKYQSELENKKSKTKFF